MCRRPTPCRSRSGRKQTNRCSRARQPPPRCRPNRTPSLIRVRRPSRSGAKAAPTPPETSARRDTDRLPASPAVARRRTPRCGDCRRIPDGDRRIPPACSRTPASRARPCRRGCRSDARIFPTAPARRRSAYRRLARGAERRGHSAGQRCCNRRDPAQCHRPSDPRSSRRWKFLRVVYRARTSSQFHGGQFRCGKIPQVTVPSLR